MNTLEELRNRLDKIDKELIEKYKERMEISKEVGEIKVEMGREVLDPIREQEKINQVTEGFQDPFLKTGIAELYQQLFTQSRMLQYQVFINRGEDAKQGFQEVDEIAGKGKRVIYQGVQGAYSHQAARDFFGEDAFYTNVTTFKDAFEAVREGRGDYAVLPMENSSAGKVGDVYDLLVKYDLSIVGEIVLPISHTLSGVESSSIESIERVYSHNQAIMQSKEFLNQHPKWELNSMENTALAAKFVSEANDPRYGAICSEEASKLYQLKVLAKEINQVDNNSTRFVVVSKAKIYRKDAEKISVCIELPHETGSLYRILSHVIFNGLNMTKILSRPIKHKTWEYRFFLDFEGNLKDGSVQNALIGIENESRKLKIFGNY